MKSILDPKDSTGEFPFKWVDSRNTDIRKTFAKHAAPQDRKDNQGLGLSQSPAVAAPISLRRKQA